MYITRHTSFVHCVYVQIKVEKYLTPAQRKKLEEQQKAEEERRLREKGDNQRERALDMMMGGVLEIRKEDELKKVFFCLSIVLKYKDNRFY